MRRAFLLLAAALLSWAGAAEANMHAPYRGHRIVPGVAPLDGFTAPAAAYGFRKLRSAYTGPGIKIRRATGGTQDIGFLGFAPGLGSPIDVAAASAFCAATTCFLDTWYDQSGNARHWVQATPATQPALVFDCIGTLPCWRTTGGQVAQAAVQVTPAGAQSISAVARVDGAAQACIWLGGAFDRLLAAAASGAWVVDNSTETLSGAAALGVWHSGTGVINGAASVINIDGTEATGTVAVVGTTNNFYGVYGSGGAGNCSQTEAIWWNGYGLTAGERIALQQNQREYYTPLPLDTFATPAGAYSFRKLKSTYSGPAVRLRRASDNLEADINFLGCTGFTGCPLDMAAANSHCAATSCFVVTLYDQSGFVRHLTNATAAAQPSLIFNCIGSLPCLEMSGGTITLAGPSVTPATGVVSMSAVAYRTGATTNFCAWMRQNGANNRIATGNTANTWQMLATGALNAPPATESVWHAVQGVINGASSAVNIDGTETTGTVTGLTTAGAVSITGSGAGIPCRLAETIVWDNVVNDAATRAVLRNNQKSFWGTP